MAKKKKGTGRSPLQALRCGSNRLTNYVPRTRTTTRKKLAPSESNYGFTPYIHDLNGLPWLKTSPPVLASAPFGHLRSRKLPTWFLGTLERSLMRKKLGLVSVTTLRGKPVQPFAYPPKISLFGSLVDTKVVPGGELRAARHGSSVLSPFEDSPCASNNRKSPGTNRGTNMGTNCINNALDAPFVFLYC